MLVQTQLGLPRRYALLRNGQSLNRGDDLTAGRVKIDQSLKGRAFSNTNSATKTTAGKGMKGGLSITTPTSGGVRLLTLSLKQPEAKSGPTSTAVSKRAASHSNGG